MSAKKPYYRWFPGDWFGGKTRLRLTGGQTATYVDFIWRSVHGQDADGYIDDTLEDIGLMLGTFTRSPDEETANLKALVSLGCIQHEEGNGYYNERALEEVAYRNKLSDAGRKGGKASGKARQQASTDDERPLNDGSTMVEPSYSLESIVHNLESKVVESKTSKTTTTKGADAPKQQQKSKPQKKTIASIRKQQAKELFEFWQEVYDRPDEPYTTKQEREVIKRLEGGVPIDNLYKAVVGYKFDDWGPRNGRNLRTNLLNVLIRDNKKTEIDMASQGCDFCEAVADSNRPKVMRLLPPRIAVQYAKTAGELIKGDVLQRLIKLTDSQRKEMAAIVEAGTLTVADIHDHAYEAVARTADPEADYGDIKARMLAGEKATPRMEIDVPEEMLGLMMNFMEAPRITEVMQ
jgi:general stress protein YciG